MPKLTTVASPIALAAAGVVALTGCSSSSSGAKSSSSAASSASSSAAPSSTAAAASSSASAPSSAAASGSAGIGEAITPLATKLGCAGPVAKAPQASAGAALDATAGITCVAGSTQYVLIQLKPGGSPTKAAKGLLAASGTKSGSVYFVSGPQWIVLGGPESTSTPPTKQDAEAIHAKIGGTVGSASA